MKNVVLFASIAMASGMVLCTVYNSLVDAKAWGSDIPNSIGAAREYFKHVNPGDNFYRIFSPINQILGLIVLVLFWKADPSVRLCLGIAFVLYVLGDVLTFAYFYPRNDIMFKNAQLTDISLLKRTWSEWNAMNWGRLLLILTGLVLSFLSLHKIYASQLRVNS